MICVEISHRMAALPIAEADGPMFDQGETEEKPRPVPSASRISDNAAKRHAQRLGGRARLVTLELDPTDDPTHGAQQLSFLNGHYDSQCYLPVMGFVSF